MKVKVKVKSLSRVRLLATPWTAAHQAPPSMGFFQARVLEWGAIDYISYKKYAFGRIYKEKATSLSLFTFMHWSRKWQHTPVFLPGESQGQGSLVGCRLWGRTELDTTEVT